MWERNTPPSTRGKSPFGQFREQWGGQVSEGEEQEVGPARRPTASLFPLPTVSWPPALPFWLLQAVFFSFLGGG